MESEVSISQRKGTIATSAGARTVKKTKRSEIYASYELCGTGCRLVIGFSLYSKILTQHKIPCIQIQRLYSSQILFAYNNFVLDVRTFRI